MVQPEAASGRIGEAVITVRKYRLIRYADRHPFTDEKLPSGTRLVWTGEGFVIESPANERLIAEFNTFDEADRERVRAERTMGVMMAVVSSDDKA